MSLTQVHKQRIATSLLTLGVGTELAAHVIKEIAGNDISNAINGEFITLNKLRALVQIRLRNRLEQNDTTGIIH